MAGLSAHFFDTSTILAGIIELGSEHSAPQTLMDAVVAGRFEGPMTAWHCCLEFYSVATRLPRELRVQPADALRLVEEEILGRFQVHALPKARRTSFLRSIVHDAIAGGRIYDAHIAEVARHAGATVVVTENRRHFAHLMRHGVRVLTSAEFAETL
jgi:toxin FitB